MMAVWIVLLIVGLAIALVASRYAVDHAATLAMGSRIPPFVIGITLLAIGTDLPEIANSIAASISDHGDLNVGDSVGSAATQVTLILGLMPIFAGAFVVGARRVVGIAAVSVVALVAGAGLMWDGHLGRLDALILIGAWIVGSWLVRRDLPPGSEPVMPVQFGRRSMHAFAAVGALLVVAAGAALAVWSFIRVAEELAVPEYLLAFFATSLGTSLPEFVVNVTALRKGERDLAVGGVFGATFVDSTLSLGAGPLIAPTAVTRDLVVPGSLLAAAAITVVAILLSRRERLTPLLGVVILVVYGLFYVVLLNI
jgi:cation:H+ antiporter